MKKIFLISLIFSINTFLLLGVCRYNAYAQNESSKAVNAGNKVCPVTGEKIDEKTKVTYQYQGRIYNFCCAACIPEFQKDPGKYIKKVEEELKSKQQANSQPADASEKPGRH
ncbi:MAG: YHS domain-containing protein [Candidatus Omnitrophica bacterium]|nr:YHS domain-containing protein [Candidatus Omnitrophota bacterium]